MLRTCFRLGIGFLLFVAVSAAQQRHALVIGNNDYSMRPLTNPSNDAGLMERVLRSVGFRVTKLVNGNKLQMETAAARFIASLGPKDTALFYYAGHAVQWENENILIPVDFGRAKDIYEARATAMSLSRFLGDLASRPIARRIVIIDACRSFPITREQGLRPGLAQPLSLESDTLLIYSALPDHTAEDNPNAPNSVFAEALAEHIPSTGQSIQTVMSQVTGRVKRLTRDQQTPNMVSSLTAPFSFVGGDDVPVDSVSQADVWLRSADEHVASARWEEALTQLARVRTVQPSSAQVVRIGKLEQFASLRLRAQSAELSGEHLNAAKALEQAAGIHPGGGESALDAANQYLLAAALPKAVEMLAEVRYRGSSEMATSADLMLRELVPVSPEASRELAEYPVRNPPVLIPSFDIESVLAHGNLLLSQSQFEVFDEAISWALLFGDRQVRKEAMPPTPVTLADGPSPDVAAAQGPVVEITPLGTARDLVFIEEQPEPPISIVGRPSGRTVPVTIRVKPFGARVTSTANASLSCPSPCTMYLAPGDHSFFVASEGYEDKTVAVVARRDGRNHDFNLELRYGAIRIDGEGIANARVFVDGRPTATALPAELSLPVGRYAVTLRAASGLEQVKHVVLSDRIFSHVVF